MRRWEPETQNPGSRMGTIYGQEMIKLKSSGKTFNERHTIAMNKALTAAARAGAGNISKYIHDRTIPGEPDAKKSPREPEK